MSNELFILGADVWDALDNNEVAAIIRDLEELDLYKLPYSVAYNVSLRINLEDKVDASP